MCSERGGKDSPGDLDSPPGHESPSGPQERFLTARFEDLTTGTHLTGLTASVESAHRVGKRAGSADRCRA
jgi:hypothetical protein